MVPVTTGDDLKDQEQSIPLLEKFVSQGMENDEQVLKEESSRDEEDVDMN